MANRLSRSLTLVEMATPATTLEARLKEEAHARGFALVGIAPATEADGFHHFQDWLAHGYAGEMKYLHRSAESRRHPDAVLPGVRSVVMLGLDYSDVPSSPIREPRSARIAKYAQGPDYHRYIWDRVNELSAWLEREAPGCTAHGVTDTAPILERDFARRAGLGWVGKNTMLIHPEHGSFFFLAALLTDLVLDADLPFTASHCGTCTACLEACPTQAFPLPMVLDATRCISYLTIEHRSPIPEELRPLLGDWLFGCDVCQDVCPWNRKSGKRDVSFPHDSGLEAIDPAELLAMDADAFRKRFKPTAIFRPRRSALLRNAALVLGNIGDECAIPVLEKAIAIEEELVREAARWAIEQIRSRGNDRVTEA